MKLTATLLLLAPALFGDPQSDRYGDAIDNGAVARLGTNRLRHTTPITVLRYVDAERLVSASQSQDVALWAAADGALLSRFRATSGAIHSAGLSRDGSQVFATTRGDMLYLWDLASGDLVMERAGVGQCVALSGDRAAAADGSGAIKLLDDDYEESLGYQPDDYQPMDLRFSDDGSVLASLRFNRNRKLRRGDLAGSGPFSGVWLYSVESLEETGYVSVEEDIQTCMAMSPDGKRVYVGGMGGSIRLIDVERGDFSAEFRAHEGGVAAVAIDPSGERLVSSGADGQLRIWDALAMNELLAVPTDRIVTRLAVSPDGAQVAAAVGLEIRILDLESGATRLQLPGHTAAVSSIAISSDGKRVLTGSYDETAILWDRASATPLRQLRGHTGFVTRVAIDPSSNRLITGALNGEVRVWGDGDEPTLAFGAHAGAVLGLAILDDGATLLTIGGDRAVRSWEADSGVQRWAHTDFKGTILSMDVSPDGKTVVVASNNVRVFNAEDGTQVREVEIARGTHTAVAYNHDGTRVAVASANRVVRVVDAETFEVVREVEIPSGRPTSLAFSPDSSRLAVASMGYSMLSVFPLDREGDPATVEVADQGISSLTWSESDDVLAVGMLSGLAYLFDGASFR